MILWFRNGRPVFCSQTGSPPATVSLQGPSTVAVFISVKLGKEQGKQGQHTRLMSSAQPVTPLCCSFSLSKSCHVTCLQASGAGKCPCLGSLVTAPDCGKGSTRVSIDCELSLVFQACRGRTRAKVFTPGKGPSESGGGSWFKEEKQAAEWMDYASCCSHLYPLSVSLLSVLIILNWQVQ